MKQESKTPAKSILITFEGNTTRATLLTGYHGDTRTKTTFAKYNPDDAKHGMPYSEFEGVRIAVARLFGLEPFPVDDEPQFEVGDLVRINVDDYARSMHKAALGKVMRKAPNKMTPYAVKILDDDRANLNPMMAGLLGFRPYETVVLPGEMTKVGEE